MNLFNTFREIGNDFKTLITRVIPIYLGGTGATTATQARTNLGFDNATLNNQSFNVVGSNLINRYSAFKYLAPNSTNTITIADSESVLQVYAGTIVYLPASFNKLTSFLIFHCGDIGTADSVINVPNGSFIYHPATGMLTTSTQLKVKAGETVELLNRGGNEYDIIGGSYLTRVKQFDIETQTIKSGAASYKKAWRSLSVPLPLSAGTTTVAHALSPANIELVGGKVTDSTGSIIFNNDPDLTRQFIVRADNTNVQVIIGNGADKIYGKTVEIFVGERYA